MWDSPFFVFIGYHAAKYCHVVCHFVSRGVVARCLS